MRRWEFKIVDEPYEETIEGAVAQMNAFGAEGWEPAYEPIIHSGRSTVRLWLKRELTSAAERRCIRGAFDPPCGRADRNGWSCCGRPSFVGLPTSHPIEVV